MTVHESHTPPRTHPRRIGWVGTAALAMGGSNQSLFLIGALIAGQGAIAGQGSAAIPLLIAGLLLSYAAAPGWTELVLMFPDRVGGISATCAEAFRPYSAVLSNLTGVCYWWGWVPTCGLTALLSASALHAWYLPSIPVPLLACGIVGLFTAVNLAGVQWATRLAVPIGAASAGLAFASAVVPVAAGTVDWHRASTFTLTVPFPGHFGELTSAMAGLYLVGFAAPAFEQATSHVGETVDPARNVPRAVLASAVMAGLYFAVLPVVWLGALGPDALSRDLALELGPTFAPVLGGAARAAAVWFMVLNMFHGTLAPLAGAARVLAQLAEDGLLPRGFARRSRTDVPWVATTVTAGMAVAFLLAGDPVWLIAAANLTYLIGICLPNVAVWLLRRDAPDLPRPYRAPRGTIGLGLVAAAVWGVATVLGFQQFGLPTVLAGIAFAYAGAGLYACRVWSDRRRAGLPGIGQTLHVKLTGAMLLVLVLDAAGYLLAVNSVADDHGALVAALADIFVVVALLTISVGLVLPGMIAHSAEEIARAADRMTSGPLADFVQAMQALAAGHLDGAHARLDLHPVVVHSRDELGALAASFNTLQLQVVRAATALDGAREGLRAAHDDLRQANTVLEARVRERTAEVERHAEELERDIAERQRAEAQVAELNQQLMGTARAAGMAEVASSVLHNVGNVLNSVNVSAELVADQLQKSKLAGLAKATALMEAHADDLGTFLTAHPQGQRLPTYLATLAAHWQQERAATLQELSLLTTHVHHIKDIIAMQQSLSGVGGMTEPLSIGDVLDDAMTIAAAASERHGITVARDVAAFPPIIADRLKLLQILVNLVRNACESLDAVEAGHERRLDLRVRLRDAWVRIEIADTGIGIRAEHRDRLFTYGFTTKPQGHGFGLHSSALAAHELGGTLRGHSDGAGRGARFVLEFPLHFA